MSAPTLTSQFNYSSSLTQPVCASAAVKKSRAGRESQSRAMSDAMQAVADDAIVSISNPGAYALLLNDILHQASSTVSAPLLRLSGRPIARPARTVPAQNARAIALLDKWLADMSGYDHEVWPEIKSAIEENRSSYRTRFDG
jgi:hypothetical protein